MEVAKRNIHILYYRHVRPILKRMSTTFTGSEKFCWPEEDLALPKGSLILVTGVTGYIASHIVNELLLLGYRVRGTVRNEEKGRKVKLFFDDHDDGDEKKSLEIVVLSDLTDAKAFDEACEGVDGVIHTASDVSFNPDPNQVIPPTVAGAVNALKSSKKAGTVKRFVYTSSSTAATMPILDTKFTIDKSIWNDTTVNKVWGLREPYKQEDAYEVYGASKTEGEKAVWKFVEDEKPEFVVNCVLPDTNFGKILNMVGVTGSIPPALLKGGPQPGVSPQWFVDVADDAKIHLAALLDTTVKDDRIFAFASTFDWNDVIDAVREARPGAEGITERLPPHGKDLSEVDNTQGAGLLKKWFGQDGWKSLEESIRENLEGQD